MTQFNAESSCSYALYLSNSAYTTKMGDKPRHFDIVEELNPSCYYFIVCLIHKELVTINGKYYWIPVAYGFITLLPFPDVFFRML